MRFVARALVAWLAVLCLWGAAGAQAEPIGYSFTTSFFDGGLAFGHFIYDADTTTYSNVSITVSGSATPSLDGTYIYPCPSADCFGIPLATNLYVLRDPPPPPGTDLTGSQVFVLTFGTPLTDARSPVTADAAYGTCNNISCIGQDLGPDAVRNNPNVLVAPPAIPTLTAWSLAAFALLLSGFAVLHLWRNRAAD
jgi:hypothetical protein